MIHRNHCQDHKRIEKIHQIARRTAKEGEKIHHKWQKELQET
ncbi:10304_t:CDS:1, partial [Cetraspora pellucida]